MIETPSVRSRPAERDQSAPWKLDVCHGYRTAFDVELKCEQGERRRSHRRQPNPRRSSVPLAPCQDQLQSATHGERVGVRGRSVFDVQCSTFGVRRSVFDVRCSTFGVRRSVLDVRCWTFGVRCSMVPCSWLSHQTSQDELSFHVESPLPPPLPPRGEPSRELWRGAREGSLWPSGSVRRMASTRRPDPLVSPTVSYLFATQSTAHNVQTQLPPT
jgi:hypothetical protein